MTQNDQKRPDGGFRSVFRNNTHRIGVVFVGIVGISVILRYPEAFAGVIDEWIVETRDIWVPMMSGLGGLGTLILAVLYYRQHKVLKSQVQSQQDQVNEISRQADLEEQVIDIQEEQTQLMKQQEEWMEAQHAPELYIEGWAATNDEIHISIFNAGNGPAMDVSIGLSIFSPDTPEEKSGDSKLELHGGSNFRQSIHEGDMDNDVVPTDARTHLFRKEIEILFLNEKITSIIEQENIDVDLLPFSEAVNRLLAGGHDSIQYKLFLRYKFIRREEESVELWSGVVDLEEGMTFEKVIENSCRENISTSAENITPDNLKKEPKVMI